ncbi:MAG: thioredoxin domain-containing protein, partial [Sulfolobaceae archaeon]
PPEDKFGRPGFKRLLTEIIRLWKEDRNKLLELANEVSRILSLKNLTNNELNNEFIENAISSIIGEIDLEYGGLNSTIKFPHPTIDELLLSHYFWSGDETERKIVEFNLKQMYYGGLFDQVGGGFHRYTVDREWWVPHFEKLLIDNAELALDYYNSYLLTKNIEQLDALNLTIDFILRELKLEDGFANSLDADSEGIEGKYYTWTLDEIRDALKNENEFKLVEKIFGLNKQGGIVEGRKVLKRFVDLDTLSRMLNTNREGAISWLNQVRRKLLEYREKTRKKPFRDDNKYTLPNCRVAEALLSSSIIIGKGLNEGLQVARKIGKNVSRRLDGGGNGTLEDHASAVLLLIKAYEISGDVKFYDRFLEIGKKLLDFRTDYGFKDSDISDNISVTDTPNESPNSLALRALIKLAIINPDEFKIPDDLIKRLASSIVLERASFFAGLIYNLASLIKGIAHIVIINENDGKAESLHRAALETYYPFKIVEVVNENRKDFVNPIVRSMIYAGKERGSRAYVCIGNTCSMPISDKEKLKELLKGKSFIR